jgi:NAD(P)-dependent dehydrogenase (short-subunit alcohol dehydrogenase family)
MRVVVVGLGTIGSAVKKLLEERGHDVVSVGRTSGDFQADISDPASLKKMFARIGQFDAVANAAGDVFPGPFEQVTDEQWAKSVAGKGMGQINLVRAPAHCGQGLFHAHLWRHDRGVHAGRHDWNHH